MVCERAMNKRWEIVLLTEILADECGVVWLGENEEACVIVHGEKVGCYDVWKCFA